MRAYVSVSMALFVASLVTPKVFGQHSKADLDGMPIFPGQKGAAHVSGFAAPIHDDSYLGLEARDIVPSRAKALGLDKPHGVEVTQVVAGSPAAKAGFKAADVVLDFNGLAVEREEQLSRLVINTPAGRQVKMSVWRSGAVFTLAPTVEAFVRDPDSWPSPINEIEPGLTPASRKAGIEGCVTLYMEIGVDGRAYRVRLVNGLGYGLDSKAMEAAAQWRFSPARKDGSPVVTPLYTEVWFRR